MTVHAERALLGSVLSDPAGQQHILDLVAREDMRLPWHGQVLAAMQRLRRRDVLPGLVEVYGELKKDPDLPRPVSHDAVPLADLTQAVPRSSHAPAYAAMVIGNGIRQRLTLAAGRMRQAGEITHNGPLDEERLEIARYVAGQARREVESCWARWNALPEPTRRQLPVPARDLSEYAEAARRAGRVRDELGRLAEDLWEDMWEDTSSSLALRLAVIAQRLGETAAVSASQRERHVQRLTSHEARPQGPAAEAAGVTALRDLAVNPAQIAEATAWLRPGHFARPEHGRLYAVMQDLQAAGMPVDRVTVSWEAARRGITVAPRDLAGGTGVFAAASTRQVYRYAALAQVAQAGRDIQASAADPGLSMESLIQLAGDRLHHLEHAPGPRQHRELEPGAEVLTAPSRAAGQQRSPEPSRGPGREAAG